MSSEVKATPGIEREGWLNKKGDKINKNFQKRWFVLANNELKYYKNKEAKEPKGTINLDGCSVDYVPETKYKRKFCFELTSPAQSRVYVLEADNGTSVQDWMNAVRKAMLKIRREKSKTSAKGRDARASSPPPAAPKRALSNRNVVASAKSSGSGSAGAASAGAGARAAASDADDAGGGASVGGAGGAGAGGGAGGEQSAGAAMAAQYAKPKNASEEQDKYDVYKKWLDESKDGQRDKDGTMKWNLLNEEPKSGCCCVIS